MYTSAFGECGFSRQCGRPSSQLTVRARCVVGGGRGGDPAVRWLSRGREPRSHDLTTSDALTPHPPPVACRATRPGASRLEAVLESTRRAVSGGCARSTRGTNPFDVRGRVEGQGGDQPRVGTRGCPTRRRTRRSAVAALAALLAVSPRSLWKRSGGPRYVATRTALDI
jgi:hypothetical protein